MRFTPDSPDPLALSEAERKLIDKQPDIDREARLDALRMLLEKHTNQGPSHTATASTAELRLESAGLLLDLDRKQEAWEQAKSAIEPFIHHERFEDAALACQYVYLADQDDALPALGQAAWLAVTYPVNPHLTANIMELITNEMPDESDGAAVVAATAHYVVDIRADESSEDLRLFTGALLARVARRHSNVDTQQLFEMWVERLELDDPSKFLTRLRNVIDVMVQEEWWFDRDALQAALPD